MPFNELRSHKKCNIYISLVELNILYNESDKRAGILRFN